MARPYIDRSLIVKYRKRWQRKGGERDMQMQRPLRVVRFPCQLIAMVDQPTSDRVRALVDPAGGDDAVSIAAVLRRVIELGLPAAERERRRGGAPRWTTPSN
jgi:hypothetical protein